MVRDDPPTYVLIHMGGTAGECIYPLALGFGGFGAPGQGGTSIGLPMNAPADLARGDLYRSRGGSLRRSWATNAGAKPHLASRALLRFLDCRDELTQCVSVAAGKSPRSTRLSSSKLGFGIEMATSTRPRRSLRTRSTNKEMMTATSYLSKRMDGAPQSDSGGWEQSAAYARFHLSCIRPTFVEICPYLCYSNRNGYLTKEEVDLSSPPPPPPLDAADDENVASAAATSSTAAPTPAKKTRSRKNKKAARNRIPALQRLLSSRASGLIKWTRRTCLQ